MSIPIRTPEDLVALYEAERAEDDAIKAREDIALLLEQPGWKRLVEWLSTKRDNAFQQLRGVHGTRDVLAESFLKWQIVDSMFEDIQDFIKLTMEHGEEILSRRQTTLQDEFLREQLHGRYDASDSGSPAGGSGDPASSTADSAGY